MTDWTARAKAVFSERVVPPTDKTDERGVSSVSSVGGCHDSSSHDGVSSVLSVPPPTLSAKHDSVDRCPIQGKAATDLAEPAYRWLLHFPDSEPEPADVPADLVALFDECLRAGLYDETERTSLPAMVAADLKGTRALLTDMQGRIGRCTRCRHFRRPGLSGGYCTGRADLPLAYGLLHSLPADGGAWCQSFGAA